MPEQSHCDQSYIRCSQCRGFGWVWSYPGTGTPGTPRAVQCPMCHGWKVVKDNRS